MAVDLTPPPDRFVRWMTTILGTLTERGAITKLELWSGSESAGREKLAGYVIDGQDPLDLAHEVYDAARAEAESAAVGGTQRFYVLAFDKGSTEYYARHPFVVDSPLRAKTFGDPAKGSTERGTDYAIAAIVKAATDTNRMFAERFDGLLTTQQRYNEALGSRLEQTQQALWDASQALNQVSRDQTAHRIEIERMMRDESRKDKLFQMASTYVPLLFANATKGTPVANAIAQNSADPLRQAMKAFLDGVTPEQLMSILDKLPENKQRALFAIAEIVGKEAEAEESSKAPQLTDGDK
jgi:hypothetical protein